MASWWIYFEKVGQCDRGINRNPLHLEKSLRMTSGNLSFCRVSWWLEEPMPLGSQVLESIRDTWCPPPKPPLIADSVWGGAQTLEFLQFPRDCCCPRKDTLRAIVPRHPFHVIYSHLWLAVAIYVLSLEEFRKYWLKVFLFCGSETEL